MRPRTIIYVLVAAILAGCGVLPPLRQFGQEPAPQPTWITTFDDMTTSRLPEIQAFGQVKKQAVKGDIDVGKALSKLDKAWGKYLGDLNDGRLMAHPTHLRAVELNADETFGTVCYMGPNHRYPAQNTRPTYCPDFDLGSPTPALMVLPTGFTNELQDFASTNGEHSAWVLTGVVAGLSYAVHLRHEMKIAGVTWPDGVPFDYCTVGISLRSLFPANSGELEGESATAILTMIDQLVSAPDEPELRLGNLVTGFESGRLEECVA